MTYVYDRLSCDQWWFFFFFSSRRRHTRFDCDWSSDVCSSDLHLKVGIGFARFGNLGRAEQELRRALDIATAHGLHEFVFKIERLTEGLSECGALEGIESAASEPAGATEALKEVSASLASLGTE